MHAFKQCPIITHDMHKSMQVSLHVEACNLLTACIHACIFLTMPWLLSFHAFSLPIFFTPSHACALQGFQLSKLEYLYHDLFTFTHLRRYTV